MRKRTVLLLVVMSAAWFGLVVLYVAIDAFRGECSLDGTGRPLSPLGSASFEFFPPRSVCHYVHNSTGLAGSETRPWSSDGSRWLVVVLPPALVAAASVMAGATASCADERRDQRPSPS